MTSETRYRESGSDFSDVSRRDTRVVFDVGGRCTLVRAVTCFAAVQCARTDDTTNVLVPSCQDILREASLEKIAAFV